MHGNPYYDPYPKSEQSDELEHFGVLGMKWGVRRYQNKDGTLTSAGKQRAKNKKERTPEEQAKHDKRVATAKKAAKITAGVAAVAAASLIGVNALSSSRAGLDIVALGGERLGQLINAGVLTGRTAASLTKEYLNATGTTTRSPAHRYTNPTVSKLQDAGFDAAAIQKILENELRRTLNS